MGKENCVEESQETDSEDPSNAKVLNVNIDEIDLSSTVLNAVFQDEDVEVEPEERAAPQIVSEEEEGDSFELGAWV